MLTTDAYQLYINGEFCDAADGATMPAVNPYNESTWAHVPVASTADVERAVLGARSAVDREWSQAAPGNRASLLIRLAELLEENAQELAVIESTDNGKIIRETQSQMHYSARIFRYFAGYCDKHEGSVIPVDQKGLLDFTQPVPYGVVAAIIAWNSPIVMLANKLGAALAAGNCCVLKPSEHASASSLAFAHLIHQAGFPPGVVNVVTGAAEVGKALVTAPGVDKVSFTGSPGVGAAIAAAVGATLRPISLELGGKSANIIFADADINAAVVGALAGIFGASGQTCIAGSRLLVQRGVYDEVVGKLVERAKTIKMGNPLDPQTEMGCAANRVQFERILSMINDAQGQGATLLTGGQAATGPGIDGGLFIEPTIFGNATNTMRLAREEIFGPVLAVIPFDTEEEAIAVANDSPYGLASGVWTQDLSKAMRMVSALHTGVVWVNTYRTSVPQAPFGGMKDSGFGRERGAEGLKEFLTTKNVMVDYSGDARDPFAMKFG